MFTQIEWRFTKSPIDSETISNIEKHFDIEFPEEYKQIVLNYNGARPKPNVYDTEKTKERTVKSLLSLNQKEEGNIFDVMNWISGKIPSKFIPFANDNSGNYLCFDYSENQKNPPIYLWLHEENRVEKVSDSFASFLSKLYLPRVRQF
ncbi:SMI1/KNR4 family protein [Aeribacillus sp. FSL k6-2211]|uniref:SMI1/KNR4 family protein n=2 Tax=Bacilli TaxID=91061 RepID=UPI0030CCE4FB